jgi:hypothetical protein
LIMVSCDKLQGRLGVFGGPVRNTLGLLWQHENRPVFRLNPGVASPMHRKPHATCIGLWKPTRRGSYALVWKGIDGGGVTCLRRPGTKSLTPVSGAARCPTSATHSPGSWSSAPPARIGCMPLFSNALVTSHP